MQNIDMGIFKPSATCQCGKCGFRHVPNAPFDWEATVRNILRFKLLLNYDANKDIYHGKVRPAFELSANKILPMILDGSKTFGEIQSKLQAAIEETKRMDILDCMANAAWKVVAILEASQIDVDVELRQKIDMFMSDHVVWDYDHESLMNEPFDALTRWCMT